MTTDAEHLRDLYLDVAETETVTERREEGHSHDPVGETEAAIASDVAAASDDGLAEAVEGTDAETSA